jgi:hypothetical protein
MAMLAVLDLTRLLYPSSQLSSDLIKASQVFSSKKDLDVGRSCPQVALLPPNRTSEVLMSESLGTFSNLALDNFLSNMSSPSTLHGPGSESGALPRKPRRRAPGRSQTVADLAQLGDKPVQRWASSLSRHQASSPQFAAMRPSQQDRSWATAATLAAAAVYAAAAQREAEAEVAINDSLEKKPSRAL